MRKLYLPLLIASLTWGSCSQDLPSVPSKNQGTTENPDTPTPTPTPEGYSKLKSLLDKLNLEDPNMFRVKAALNAQDSAQVQIELLRYFRARTELRSDVKHASVHPEDKADYPKTVAPGIQKQADDALNHIFLANKNFDPIDYGDDIDWGKSHPENEVRWQLHRMYWWIPMGQTYWAKRDEKYAKEWVAELQDWIKKNPCDPSHSNFRWAWRQLEIGIRISDQTDLFNYFAGSEYFTPEVLIDFLLSYWTQCDYLKDNYPDNGNHMLFCGKGVYIAGNFFPEFKAAETWRNSGSALLKGQLAAQVLADGVQIEFAPQYQAAAITEFLGATDYAILNNRPNDFGQEYMDKIRQMIKVVTDISMNIDGKFDFPMFGDTPHKGSLSTNFTNWLKYYPEDPQIQFFANSTKGSVPPYTSSGFSDGGFYTLRDGWKLSNIMMSVTAHPQAADDWHSHPDFGTFELSVDGILYMPDAGFYKYEGDAQTNAERKRYRKSAMHQIMTLDDQDIQITNSEILRTNLDTKPNSIRVKNEAYTGLTTIRTIYFNVSAADEKCYVIVDEGTGDAEGKLDVHYKLKENTNAIYDADNRLLYTKVNVDKKRELMIQAFCQTASDFKLTKREEYADISYTYGESVKGEAFSFQVQKSSTDQNVQIVTVLYPFAPGTSHPQAELVSISGTGADNTLTVTLKLNGTERIFK